MGSDTENGNLKQTNNTPCGRFFLDAVKKSEMLNDARAAMRLLLLLLSKSNLDLGLLCY